MYNDSMKNDVIICYDTNEICSSYQDYLMSRHWKDLKTKWIKEKGKNTCGICKRDLKNSFTFDFHHLTYQRIGNEKLNDITIVCHDGCRNKSNYPKKELNRFKKNIKAQKQLREKEIRNTILEINFLNKSSENEFKVQELKKKLYSLY